MKAKIGLFFLFVLIFAGFQEKANCQIQWFNTTQFFQVYGCNFDKLACNSKGEIFAVSSNNGIFCSVDNGISWQIFDTNSESVRYPTSMIITRNDDIFVSTNPRSIFRHLNNEKIWKEVLYLNDYRETIKTLAIADNGDIFAASNFGSLYISSNNGDSWDSISNIKNRNIYSLIFDKENRLYAATDSLGICRSIDYGQSWETFNRGFPKDTAFSALTMAINEEGEIYAGTDLGIYRLSKNSIVWDNITDIIKPINIYISDLGDIFAFKWHLYYSSDKGSSWNNIDEVNMKYNDRCSVIINKYGYIFRVHSTRALYRSLEPIYKNEQCLKIKIEPSDSKIIYWGDSAEYKITVTDKENNRIEEAKVKIVDNINDTIVELSTNSSGECIYTVIIPNDKQIGIYYIHFSATKDGYDISEADTKRIRVMNQEAEDNWIQVINNSNALGMEELTANGSNIYVNAIIPCWSSNYGETWEYLNKDSINPRGVDDIEIMRTGDIIATSNIYGGIWFSKNKGDNWINTLPEVQFTNKISINSLNNIFVSGKKEIYRSRDYGKTWEMLLTGFDTLEIKDLIIDINDNIFIHKGTNELYISSDNGDTWKKISSIPELYPIKHITTSKEGVLFVVITGGYLYKSSNNGNTWQKINASYLEYISKIFTTNKGYYFISTDEDGLYVSTDKGITWKEYNEGFECTCYLCRIKQLIISNDYAFASSGSSILYRRKINLPPVTEPNILFVSVEPQEQQALDFNDSYNYEIFVADNSQNIIQGAIVTIDDELNDTLITLTTDFLGTVFYLSTVPGDIDSGVYSIKFTAKKAGYLESQVITRKVYIKKKNSSIFNKLFKNSKNISGDFSIEPNPVNSIANIHFTISEYSLVKITAYDILGRLAANIADANFSEGAHSIQWNCGALPTGIYIIVMENQRKMFVRYVGVCG